MILSRMIARYRLVWQSSSLLQELGLGTKLIAAAEDRILKRGETWSVFKVETDRERVRKFYERLGHSFCGRESASWEVDDEAGCTRMYETELMVLRKKVLVGS